MLTRLNTIAAIFFARVVANGTRLIDGKVEHLGRATTSEESTRRYDVRHNYVGINVQHLTSIITGS